MNEIIRKWISFFSRRFTSFRFSWSFFSLFMSIGTFSIVLSDRLTWISIPTAVIGSCLILIILSVFLDKSGIRQIIYGTESNYNPKMMELMQDVKDIKEMLKWKKDLKNQKD